MVDAREDAAVESLRLLESQLSALEMTTSKESDGRSLSSDPSQSASLEKSLQLRLLTPEVDKIVKVLIAQAVQGLRNELRAELSQMQEMLVSFGSRVKALETENLSTCAKPKQCNLCVPRLIPTSAQTFTKVSPAFTASSTPSDLPFQETKLSLGACVYKMSGPLDGRLQSTFQQCSTPPPPIVRSRAQSPACALVVQPVRLA